MLCSVSVSFIICKADIRCLILILKGGMYYGNQYELTKEEAEAYMAELSDFELDDKAVKGIAGGKCYIDCFGDDCSGRDF